ncbi:MAG: helix-turn-helix transcriptional regulator [Spirochaetaceae bacterium]|nr:helix-turn-helix transcriptional regulator [Spirochaetaceae bacterium]MBQ8561651.1 helix-turn-helix transcriptional regulator [Spirochaetaceae bacterium]
MCSLQRVFINNLKYFRKSRGLRQLDLALEIGKSSNYINSIENGKYFPPLDTIEQISRCLQIEPVQLFDQRACLENLVLTERKDLAQEIIEKLYTRLREDLYAFIKEDVEDVLR